MDSIKLNINDVLGTVSRQQIDSLLPEAQSALELVEKATGPGNDFLGWVDLPSATTPQL